MKKIKVITMLFMVILGLAACSREPQETEYTIEFFIAHQWRYLSREPQETEYTIEDFGATIVAAGAFWEDWWNLRGAFSWEHIDDYYWAYWIEQPHHPRSRGFSELLPSSGFETITDIALHLQQFYTDTWINREMFGDRAVTPADAIFFGEPWAFEEYDGVLYIASARAGFIRPDWTTATHTLISQDDDIAVVETVVFAYDHRASGNEMPKATFRIVFENGRIDSGFGQWEWPVIEPEFSQGFYAPFEDYMLFAYRPEDFDLSNFDAILYMPHPALPGVDIQGEDILIGATRSIYNISLILIENIWDEALNQDGFTVTESFLIADFLNPNQFIIINNYVGLGSLPWSGITFTTAPGERHFFAMNHDNSDSPSWFVLLDITEQMMVG